MAKCKSTSKDKRLKVAKRMPPLKRRKDGENYCYINDEVYDPKLKVWHGADYYEIECNED